MTQTENIETDRPTPADWELWTHAPGLLRFRETNEDVSAFRAWVFAGRLSWDDEMRRRYGPDAVRR